MRSAASGGAAPTEKGVRMRRIGFSLVAACFLMLGCGDSDEAADEAREMPPAGAMSLLEIAQMLDSAGYGPILEIEFDDGVWEMEGYMDGEYVEIELDPMSGETR